MRANRERKCANKILTNKFVTPYEVLMSSLFKILRNFETFRFSLESSSAILNPYKKNAKSNMD